MTSIINRKNTAIIVATIAAYLCTAHTASGQGANQKSMNENSPYNRYGVGLMEEIASGVIRGMGGGGTAFSDEISTNSANPASYSYMLATTLDGGFAAKQRTVAFSGQTPVNSFTGTLSYLNLVIPIKKFGGVAMGFQPVSNAYYYAVDTGNIAGDPVSTSFSGRGGLNDFFVGLSGKYAGLSAGVNAHYTFGSIDHTSYMTGYGLSSLRSYRMSDRNRFSGWNFQIGLMYKVKLPQESSLNLGATFAPGYTLKGSKDYLATSANEIIASDGTMQTLNVDTVSYLSQEQGTMVMPSRYGFGIQYHFKNKLELLGDIQYSDWSKYTSYGQTDSIAQRTLRASIGFGFTPNANALYTTVRGNYAAAVTYRIGAYYAQDYVYLRGQQLTDIGGTFGLSFPLKKATGTNQIGKIHTSLIVGRRGTFDAGLARENFVRFTISASLNDIWFIKPKYD